MKFDAYTLKARIAPASITVLIPLLIFNHFCASEELRKLLGEILGLKLLSAITISTVSIFFLAELSRITSKQFFQKVMFQDELYMPTTEFMLYFDNTYSDDFKDRFRAKVLKDFKINLPTADDEKDYHDETRRRIAESITSIRRKLKSNSFLIQHNIEYGAIRNSLGGAIWAIIISLLDMLTFIYYFKNYFAMLVSVVLAFAYTVWVAMGPWLVRIYGRSYAKVLFREYMK